MFKLKSRLVKLDRRLRQTYFTKHYKKTCLKCIIPTMLVLEGVIVLPSYYMFENLSLTLSLGIVSMYVTLCILNTKIDRMYMKKRTNKRWLNNYKSEIRGYMLDLLYSHEILKSEFESYYIYSKIEMAELELNDYLEREKELQRLASTQTHYEIDHLLSMEKKEQRSYLKEICLKETTQILRPSYQ